MKTVRPAVGTGFLSLFAVLSLASISMGCLVAAAHGVPPGVWVRNLAAWGVGGLTGAALARFAGPQVLGGLVLAAPLGLIASLFSAGQEGVHRWIDVGPLHVNVAAVLLPPAVVAWGALSPRLGWPWLSAALALMLLIAQPDASQATALGGALVVVVGLGVRRRWARWGGLAIAAAGMVAAWLRPDPLAPVAEVEGVMDLAWRLSPLAAVFAWITLVGAASSPMLLGAANGGVRPAAIALSVYGVLSVLTPLLGAFPVPLVGMGLSPILGAWLGAGLLTALWRFRNAAPP